MKYIFLTKTGETKVIAKQSLDREALKALKGQGFKKHHIEVEAENEREAIEKLHKDNEDNLNALSDFSGHTLYAAVFGVLVLIVIFFAS